MLEVSIFWSLIHVLVMFLFLYEYRCSKKTMIMATGITITLLLAFNGVLMVTYGVAFVSKWVLVTCTVPSLILFFLLARERNTRFLFTFCLVDTVSAGILLATRLIDHFLHAGDVLTVLLRLIAFPLLEWAIWKWFRKPYLEIQHTVRRGWPLFALLTGLFYLLLAIMSSWPTMIFERPEDIPTAVLILIIMPLTYATIFWTSYQQLEVYRVNERRQVFLTQASMMEQRAKTIHQAEEKIRIERHDLRHQLQGIASLLEEGNIEAALEYIGVSSSHLDEAAPELYCSNVILNAILSAYFKQAKEAGITVKTRLEIPDELPVDTFELATVFANTLENAIHACAVLPKEQRHIICKCIASPRFLLEVSNTCDGTIRFDENGLPVASAPDHGTGTRSVSAFVEKYNAMRTYRLEDGWFRLQIAL